ncbi:hypothetical protein [Streptomyces phaeoluteigriseus]|uniref:hypothetical protein n=1 Tax=Streptomyces phaeoluteigriseus TaxID=114686 RepID=UPI00117D89B7
MLRVPHARRILAAGPAGLGAATRRAAARAAQARRRPAGESACGGEQAPTADRGGVPLGARGLRRTFAAALGGRLAYGLVPFSPLSARPAPTSPPSARPAPTPSPAPSWPSSGPSPSS